MKTIEQNANVIKAVVMTTIVVTMTIMIIANGISPF